MSNAHRRDDDAWAGLSVGGGRSVSRRSSVVSTSSSFFDRSFFSTPESRIGDHARRATLAHATLMLNVYNNIALDLRGAVDANRRAVVQAVAAKTRAAQLAPTLRRVHADADDAIVTARAVAANRSFASINDLLCHSLQVHDAIAHAKRAAAQTAAARP
ncbi:hypothetical protein IWW50_004801 [Coemansia erecta]|nr:hypothetical protein GGF43_004178 [Coemansia sp. RSA 2618]KAJ2821057.1 hypothetical protein IWW50_004801 [Coemansia erecta]